METTHSPTDLTSRNTDVSIEALQGFLRAELSAVETYELALTSITHVGLRRALQEILASHGRRSEQLRARITGLGTEPATSSGVWGAFAKAVQTGADLLGDHIAIAALEQGEDRALSGYIHAVDDVDWSTQKFVEMEMLPEQRHTHELCGTLKTYTKSPS